jgi:hypothetical protein
MCNGLFGYTCFKQKKDVANPRGFSQRSLVVLSELPLVEFFEKLSEFIVFKTFNSVPNEEMEGVLSELCKQIGNWPNPLPKAQFTLPVLQYELDVEIPNYLPTQ